MGNFVALFLACVAGYGTVLPDGVLSVLLVVLSHRSLVLGISMGTD